MDLEQRTQLFASIADAKARMIALGTFDDGWDDFDSSVRKQAESKDDAALKTCLLKSETFQTFLLQNVVAATSSF